MGRENDRTRGAMERTIKRVVDHEKMKGGTRTEAQLRPIVAEVVRQTEKHRVDGIPDQTPKDLRETAKKTTVVHQRFNIDPNKKRWV